MRILVTGSRAWPDANIVAVRLARIADGHEDVTLVSGHCPIGADAQAEYAASKYGWKIETHPADWKQHGRRAGFLRNKEMVDLGADVCVAFITNSSKGASMTAELAEKAGIPTERYTCGF